MQKCSPVILEIVRLLDFTKQNHKQHQYACSHVTTPYVHILKATQPLLFLDLAF